MSKKNLFDQIKQANLTPEEIRLMDKSVKQSMFKSLEGIMDNIDQLKDSSNKLIQTILRMEEEKSKSSLDNINLNTDGGLKSALELVKNVLESKSPLESELKLYQELLNEITSYIDNSYYYTDGTKLMDTIDSSKNAPENDKDRTYVDPEKLDFNKLHERLVNLSPKYTSFVDYNLMFFTKGVDVMTNMIKEALIKRKSSDEESEAVMETVQEQVSSLLDPFLNAVDSSKKGFKSAVESMENYKSLNSKLNLLKEIID